MMSDCLHRICLDCGVVSEASSMESVLVYDGLGIERDEYSLQCPSCESLNIADAAQCECCGEWFDWAEVVNDACIECAKKLENENKGE